MTTDNRTREGASTAVDVRDGHLGRLAVTRLHPGLEQVGVGARTGTEAVAAVHGGGQLARHRALTPPGTG